jgi:hypothetical protein
MGYRAIAAVLHHSKSTGTTRAVLTAIAFYHDDQGDNGAWPSQEVLAERSGCSVRSVQRALKELVDLGEIDLVTHGGRGKTFDRQTNRYFIILQCPDTCDSSLNHKDLHDTFDEVTRQLRRTNTPNWADLHDNVGVLTVKNS